MRPCFCVTFAVECLCHYRVEVYNAIDATEQSTYSALTPFPTIQQTAGQTSIQDTLELVRSNNKLWACMSRHCAGSWLPHALRDEPEQCPLLLTHHQVRVVLLQQQALSFACSALHSTLRAVRVQFGSRQYSASYFVGSMLCLQ